MSKNLTIDIISRSWNKISWDEMCGRREMNFSEWQKFSFHFSCLFDLTFITTKRAFLALPTTPFNLVSVFLPSFRIVLETNDGKLDHLLSISFFVPNCRFVRFLRVLPSSSYKFPISYLFRTNRLRNSPINLNKIEKRRKDKWFV